MRRLFLLLGVALTAPLIAAGLNFIPDYPGVDDDADHTAKVRHRIQGAVTAVFGDRGVIAGRTTTVLCAGSVPSPHSIVTNFTVHTPGVGTTRCW